MKNIESVLQIKNCVAVIAAGDLAVLLGRKLLSVLRAIDVIPSEYLSAGMFLMINGEVFLTSAGVCMVDMSSRHLRMRRRVMMALHLFDAEYREARMAEFHAAMPPKLIIKALVRLGDFGFHKLALKLFKVVCWFKKYDPAKTVNIPKAS